MELVYHFPGKKYINALLKAGYVEFGKLHETCEGTPQGGVVTPPTQYATLNMRRH